MKTYVPAVVMLSSNHSVSVLSSSNSYLNGVIVEVVPETVSVNVKEVYKGVVLGEFVSTASTLSVYAIIWSKAAETSGIVTVPVKTSVNVI